MADIPVSFFEARKIRTGTSVSSPPTLEGETNPPVNPPNNGVSVSYIGLTDTFDSDYSGKNGWGPEVVAESGLKLVPKANTSIDGLIEGGVVQWTGIGYDFNVSSALARFQSVVLNSNAAVLSLTTPDATNDRIDLFILQILFDGDGIPNGMEADFITGTPAGSPVKPQIDPATQIELTQVTVTAASSTPTLTEEVIYDENIEWTGSSSGTGTVAFNSAANPFQGSLSIESTNIQNGLKIRLTDGSDYDLSGVQTLGMQLDLKAQMFAGQNIGVTFLDSTGAAISTELTLNFDKISTDYQFIGIALSQFSFTSFLARSIEFRYIRTKGATVHSGFFLDIIKLEGGINPPSVGGIPEAPNDGFAYTRKSNAWARLTPYDLAQEGASDGDVLTWVDANSRYEPVASSAGASKWTDGTGFIYRNSPVVIGDTAWSNSAALTVKGNATASSWVLKVADSAGSNLISLLDDRRLWLYSNIINIGNNPSGVNGVTIKTFTTTGVNAFAIVDSAGSNILSILADGQAALRTNRFNIGASSASAATGVTVKVPGTGFTKGLEIQDSSQNIMTNLYANGSIVTIGTRNGFGIQAGIITNGSHFKGSGTGTAEIFVIQNGSDQRAFEIRGNRQILMAGLPTSDPGVVNSLWNDAGTLKISL